MHSSSRPERIRRATPTRRIADRIGAPEIPRVVEHEPRPGDVHPVDRKLLLRLLRRLPAHLLRGVSRIELRARTSADVGKPFGTYYPRETLIRLYSVPFPDWPCELEILRPKSLLAGCGATLIHRDGQKFIHWTHPLHLAKYFFVTTFAHELAHHYVYKNRRRRSLPTTLRGHEQRADNLMFRLGALAAFKGEFGVDESSWGTDH